jgi:ferritin-like metal-binding protein YciE
LVKALPKMAKAASSAGLKEAITAHLEETKGQVERLNKVAELLGLSRLSGKKCLAMEGLVEEGREVIEAEGEPEILDAALIAAAQRVEHYEISAYGTARTFAEYLGHKEAAKLLQESLDEEAAADEKLTTVCENEVLPAASRSGEGHEEESVGEEDEEETVSRK